MSEGVSPDAASLPEIAPREFSDALAEVIPRHVRSSSDALVFAIDKITRSLGLCKIFGLCWWR